jgi:hypothetical protein
MVEPNLGPAKIYKKKRSIPLVILQPTATWMNECDDWLKVIFNLIDISQGEQKNA